MQTTFEVLWKTDAAIAVHKPAGLPTQAPPGITSLETLLREQLDRVDDYVAFPHRLDRVVSGVLLVALTKRAARLLSAQFATRKTAKQYRAVVEGLLDLEPEQHWEDFVRKVDGEARVECLSKTCGEAKPGGEAKPVSTWVTSERVDETVQQTRLILRPITGRMHQLRVQTASRGHPIVGDVLYGAKPLHAARMETGGKEKTPAVAGVGDSNRPASIRLHAEKLEFHDPNSGRRTVVTATCPF
jgi:23S rRNA-/tRNA-specific pseudouridylate synthase